MKRKQPKLEFVPFHINAAIVTSVGRFLVYGCNCP